MKKRTLRACLKELWNNGYAQHAEKPQVNDAMNFDIDQAEAEILALFTQVKGEPLTEKSEKEAPIDCNCLIWSQGFCNKCGGYLPTHPEYAGDKTVPEIPEATKQANLGYALRKPKPEKEWCECKKEDNIYTPYCGNCDKPIKPKNPPKINRLGYSVKDICDAFCPKILKSDFPSIIICRIKHKLDELVDRHNDEGGV